jgi:DNA-binding NarL/FixJ family response regulator
VSEQIRIFIVDDHDVVREGLAVMLATESDFLVAGQAADGDQALAALAGSEADVILMDLEMPNKDGVETLRAMDEAGMTTPVIVFTVFDTDDRIIAAVQAGARGYLLKSAPRQQLFDAIRVVYAGGTLLQPVVATRLLDRLRGGDGQDPDDLTTRELQVLQILATGQQNKEIADALLISERTVKFHVSALLRKLGAGNRTEAVALATERGIIKGATR